MPPPMLSSMCAALVVPVRATVTAGWLTTYLRKNCAQVLASNSAAQSGRGVRARALEEATAVEGEVRHETDLPLLGERQDRLLDAAVAHVVVDADEVDRLVAHDRLELAERGLVEFGEGRGDARRCTGRVPPSSSPSGRRGTSGRCWRRRPPHDQVDLRHFEPRELRLDLRSSRRRRRPSRRWLVGRPGRCATRASTRRTCSESRARWQLSRAISLPARRASRR